MPQGSNEIKKEIFQQANNTKFEETKNCETTQYSGSKGKYTNLAFFIKDLHEVTSTELCLLNARQNCTKYVIPCTMLSNIDDPTATS